MADDSGNEDSWLYGDSNPEPPSTLESSDPKNIENEKSSTEAGVPATTQVLGTEHSTQIDKSGDPTILTNELAVSVAETNGVDVTKVKVENGVPPEDCNDTSAAPTADEEDGVDNEQDEEDDDDDDSDDDDVQVTIGDIKTAPTYTSINLKRGLAADKNKQPGKFSIEEFEAVGTINGVAAHEFNLDSLEDKPWRKPGADITDYFNYGFNEDTWRAYCERQKRIRIHDSGVGLMSLGGPTKVLTGSIPVTIVNDNSKYSGIAGPKKAGPPPGRKLAGTIDVIGGNPSSSRRTLGGEKAAATTPGTPTPEPQENPIQVMTADRREYGRSKPGFPDLSVPPPMPPFDMPPPNIDTIPPFTGAGSYNDSEFYPPEADHYYQNYEPTQDVQWGQQPWDGEGGAVAVSNVVIPLGGDEDRKPIIRERPRSRERRDSSTGEKDDISSEKDRSERHRESRHRHRSRSRSRSGERSSRSSKKRNKSRSRSPHRHRSKKKSRRERDESD